MPPTGSAPKKKRNGLLIGLIAGGAALVLVIGAVVAVVLVQKLTPASTEPGKATTSVAALRGYLGALAAGDADKAKRYAKNPPADSPTLTNEFLAASVAATPITEIEVVETMDSGTSADDSATYRIGATRVKGHYRLTEIENVWKLDSVVADIDRPRSWGTLGVTINGMTAPTSKFALFPGLYQLGTGTSLLEFEHPAFTLDEPTGLGFSFAGPALTDAGKRAMITKSQEWLTHCLPIQETNPKDCGMNRALAPGKTLATGTLKRVVVTDAPFSTGTPWVADENPKMITMFSYVEIKVAATDTDGGRYLITESVTTAVGTINGENITVVFTD